MIIYLEGNIGSGKSTLIKFLQDYILEKGIDADELEPVEGLPNVNILQHYYQTRKIGLLFK